MRSVGRYAPESLSRLLRLSKDPVGRSQVILLATDRGVGPFDLALQITDVGVEFGHAKAIERKNVQPRPGPLRQIIAHVFARLDRRCLMPKALAARGAPHHADLRVATRGAAVR